MHTEQVLADWKHEIDQLMPVVCPSPPSISMERVSQPVEILDRTRAARALERGADPFMVLRALAARALARRHGVDAVVRASESNRIPLDAKKLRGRQKRSILQLVGK